MTVKQCKIEARRREVAFWQRAADEAREATRDAPAEVVEQQVNYIRRCQDHILRLVEEIDKLESE